MSATPDDDVPCTQIVDLVTAYLEDRLSADDRRRFDAHLEGCAGCAEYVSQMRVTIARTGALAEEEVPPETLDRLRAAFRDWAGAGPP